MIERPRLLVVGRTEVPEPTTRAVLHLVRALEKRAEEAYLRRWPDVPERWDRWNVMALVGPFRRWDQVHFLRYVGLGERAVPPLSERLVYTPLLEHVDPDEVDPHDPPVLHRSWRVLGEPKDGHERGWRERLRTMEKKLGRLIDYPEAQTRRGFEAALKRRGWKLREEGMGSRGQIKLVPLGL